MEVEKNEAKGEIEGVKVGIPPGLFSWATILHFHLSAEFTFVANASYSTQ